MKKSVSIPGAILLAKLSGGALAHGEEKEAGHDDPTAGIEIEQKPWGIAAAASEATHTIAVSKSDAMRFTPGDITVEAGETVRFVVSNTGDVMHEFVLGTQASNDEHAKMMIKFQGPFHARGHAEGRQRELPRRR